MVKQDQGRKCSAWEDFVFGPYQNASYFLGENLSRSTNRKSIEASRSFISDTLYRVLSS